MNRFSFILSIIITSVILYASCYISEYRSNNNELHILTWGDFFSDEAIEDFEQKHNTTIHLHYYATNEELINKLKHSKQGDFDLIVPSDYAVKLLIKEGLLSPLQKNKLPLDKVSPQLLNRPFDPNNRYSIPYTWEFYGLASWHKPHTSYASLFTEPNIVMSPDPMEATSIAAQLLFNKQDNLTEQQLEQVTQYLSTLHKNAIGYADYRAPFLLQSKDTHLALLRSSLAWPLIKNTPEVHFAHPSKNIFITIENFAIPRGSKKHQQIYSFIEHSFTPSIQAIHVSLCPMYPSNPQTLKYLHLSSQAKHDYKNVLQSDTPCFFSHITSEKEIHKISTISKNH